MTALEKLKNKLPSITYKEDNGDCFVCLDDLITVIGELLPEEKQIITDAFYAGIEFTDTPKSPNAEQYYSNTFKK